MPAISQNLKGYLQILPRPRPLRLRDLLRRSRCYHVTAALAAFRTQVDDPVRGADHVEIVLDHEQRPAVFDQPLKRPEQLGDVVEVQARRRLIENVERALAR